MGEAERRATLEARITRLEAANKPVVAGIACLVAFMLVGAAPSQEAPEVIRGQAIEVVDDAGNVQARLMATVEGPELQLLDGEGVARVSLAHSGEATALDIRDGEGTTRVGVALFAHGGGGIALHGEHSKGAAVLYLKSGNGSLTFYGTDGSVIQRLSGRASGERGAVEREGAADNPHGG